MKRFLLLLLFLTSYTASSQVYVTETINKDTHTFDFVIDGKKCMVETYIEVDEKLIAHGEWQQYDSNGYMIAKYKYIKNKLVSVSMLVNKYWVTKQI